MTFSYPLTMDEADTDFVSFVHRPYRTNSTASDSGGGIAPPSSGSMIRLYMPNSTPSVTNINNWASATFSGPLGKVQQEIAVAGQGAIEGLRKEGFSKEGLKEVASRTGSAMSGILDEAGPAAGQLGTKMLAGVLPAFNSENQIMAFTQGKIYNPNVELLYDGPTLRTFGFKFDFVARSQQESDMIDNIIMEFKKWSAADDEGEFITVPHVWDVTYLNAGVPNAKMNKFKTAALTAFTVHDNAGQNLHTTFRDGTPTNTSIALQFSEVDVIFRGDHEKVGGRGF